MELNRRQLFGMLGFGSAVPAMAHTLRQQETKPTVSSPTPLLPWRLSSQHGLTLPEMVTDTMQGIGVLGPGETPSQFDLAFGLKILEGLCAKHDPWWYQGRRFIPPHLWHSVRHALARELCPYYDLKWIAFDNCVSPGAPTIRMGLALKTVN